MSAFPDAGRAWPELADEMRAMKADDVDWRRGRSPLYVFGAGEDVEQVAREAYALFFTENALGAKRAFASLRRMEEEVLAASLELLQAPEGARGIMTTGGSESLFLALAACRERARSERGGRGPWNIVVPYSAHPGFDKAGRFLDVEVRRVPTRDDFRADVEAMASACDDRTIMLVGSAPSFPHGLVDPIPALSELAVRRGIWLHVDACVGGYIAPFARALGRRLPDFDFSCKGVRSISADLHKIGYCPKPASTLLLRDAAAYEAAVFDFEDWPGGRFTTPTLAGTRPGGAVAGAWAVMRYLGRSGYLDLTRRALAMADAYADGIEGLDGLHLWTRPDLTILSWGSAEVDVFALAERMRARGWLPGLTRRPPGMHMMTSLLHEPVREEYLRDLEASLGEARRAGETAPGGVRGEARYR